MDISTVGKTLGKDDFLKLFTSQLRYQDPLNPVEGAEFTAQLAQFSSLEQLFNMNKKIEELLTYQSSLNNSMAINLMGRNVTTQDGSTGKVTGVNFENGITYLVLDNDKKFPLGEIKELYGNI
ncbi:MAG: flagellar hook assembly protein FlgD [Desulfobacterales bacterium]|nr:flagellar hook assembly protein FlgD [Desulfobacterales bacterium]